jgi:hypothetical protein
MTSPVVSEQMTAERATDAQGSSTLIPSGCRRLAIMITPASLANAFD